MSLDPGVREFNLAESLVAAGHVVLIGRGQVLRLDVGDVLVALFISGGVARAFLESPAFDHFRLQSQKVRGVVLYGFIVFEQLAE